MGRAQEKSSKSGYLHLWPMFLFHFNTRISPALIPRNMEPVEPERFKYIFFYVFYFLFMAYNKKMQLYRIPNI